MAKQIDWEAIEREYRANVRSIREIGREHGVSDTAIRKKAKEEAWSRDLGAKVRERTKDKLVRALSSQSGSQEQRTQTEREIIEEASDVQAGVIKTHRGDISTGRRIVKSLMGELIEATENREEIETAIEEATAADRSEKRAAMMRRAVALPSRASTMLALSGAMKNLIALERQAFNIDGQGDGGGELSVTYVTPAAGSAPGPEDYETD